MLYFSPTSLVVKTSLSDNLVSIMASDGTTSITFEALNYSSRIKEMLILAGQALASSNSPSTAGPLLIEYDTLNGLNLFVGIVAPLA